MDIKQLQTTFIGKGQVKGFIFTQLKKSKYGYLYEVKTPYSTHYEVFKHKVNIQFNCISYPSDKSFGFWAWCCPTLERAIEKFEELEIRGER